MKFGIRVPSLKRRIAARTSWKRIARHSLGLKAPRGMRIFTHPKKALYNRIYNKTSFSIDRLPGLRISKKPPKQTYDGRHMTVAQNNDGSIECPRCKTNMGQPASTGWIIKRLVFTCSKCGLEAKIKKPEK